MLIRKQPFAAKREDLQPDVGPTPIIETVSHELVRILHMFAPTSVFLML
jgi:hypothetical protein